jgi:hypothetical protein
MGGVFVLGGEELNRGVVYDKPSTLRSLFTRPARHNSARKKKRGRFAPDDKNGARKRTASEGGPYKTKSKNRARS